MQQIYDNDIDSIWSWGIYVDGYANVQIGGVKNWISAGQRLSEDNTKYLNDPTGAIKLKNVKAFVVSENILYQSQGEYAGTQEIKKLFPAEPVGPECQPTSC